MVLLHTTGLGSGKAEHLTVKAAMPHSLPAPADSDSAREGTHWMKE